MNGRLQHPLCPFLLALIANTGAPPQLSTFKPFRKDHRNARETHPAATESRGQCQISCCLRNAKTCLRYRCSLSLQFWVTALLVGRLSFCHSLYPPLLWLLPVLGPPLSSLWSVGSFSLPAFPVPQESTRQHPVTHLPCCFSYVPLPGRIAHEGGSFLSSTIYYDTLMANRHPEPLYICGWGNMEPNFNPT